MHSVMPASIRHLDSPELRKRLQESSRLASDNWGCDEREAMDEVVRRLSDNITARRSLGSALRYLRDIPEQDQGETV